MMTKRIIKSLLLLFVVLFIVLSVYLVYAINTYGTRWFASPYNTRVQNRRRSITPGDILDRNGIVLATTDESGERVYRTDETERLSTALIVGDDYGQAVGAESFFASYLLGFDRGVWDMLVGNPSHGSDISLTIDARLCERAYRLLDGNSGAVILLNYQTGEIIASTSAPAYDPDKVDDYIAGKETPKVGAMVNRATSGRYVPGSVFKIITTLAAMRNIDGLDTMEFDCSGGMVFDHESGAYLGNSDEVDVTTLTEKYTMLSDYRGAVHGTLSIEEAFARSCNTTFAKLAIQVGDRDLYRTAVAMGLNENYLFSDIMAISGTYEHAESDRDLAWAGVGQYDDIMSPLNMCIISAGIANGGIAQEPKLLHSAITQGGTQTYGFKPEPYKTMMTELESQTLRDYMLAVVEYGTGTAAQIPGQAVCGKTGTAEVTIDGQNLSHAWFTGFIDSADHPLAICVIVEFAGGGGSVAAPIAKELFEAAINAGY